MDPLKAGVFLYSVSGNRAESDQCSKRLEGHMRFHPVQSSQSGKKSVAKRPSEFAFFVKYIIILKNTNISMSTRERILSHGLGISAFALCAVMLGQQPSSTGVNAYGALPLGASISLAHAEETPDTTDPAVRTALRLQHRLRSRGLAASMDAVIVAVRERQRLMRHSVRMHFMTETGSGATWTASAQSEPLWVLLRPYGAAIAVALDDTRILASIQSLPLNGVPRPIDATITGIRNGVGVDRVTTDTAARPGYLVDANATKDALIRALALNQPSVEVRLLPTAGKLLNQTGVAMRDLTLLATGHSNFHGSPAGRVANVRKALNNHLHNAVIAPGATFSFAEALADPLNPGGRWEQAKVINGGVLTLESGGGICQASTTMYRTLLNAGLPIVKRQSHSMYVSYYEIGGVGLDATVYRGTPDLQFMNDTGNTLVVQAYDDGNDAYVHIYGTPDGRVSALDGPYFRETAPEGFTVDGRALKKNEIGWSQTVTYADGRVIENSIVSTYKTLPRSIVTKYTEQKKQEQEAVAMQ